MCISSTGMRLSELKHWLILMAATFIHSLSLSLAPYRQPAKIPPFYLAFIIRVRRAFAVNVENAFFRSVRFSTNFDIIATVASSHRLLLVLV